MNTWHLKMNRGAKALDIRRCGENDGRKSTKYTGNGKSRHETSILIR